LELERGTIVYWEQRSDNASLIDAFKRDYANPSVSVTTLISRYYLGDRKSTYTVHGIAKRLGLPPRVTIPRPRRAALRLGLTPRRASPAATRNTLDSIQAERTRLLETLKSLEIREANLRVSVKPVAGGRVSISGLAEDPITVQLDQIRTFVQGGGLGKLRDLIGKESSTC
jgi:hypothetical protein